MSRDELLAIARNDCGGDYERAHAALDDAMLAFIDDAELTEAYNAMPRWCA